MRAAALALLCLSGSASAGNAGFRMTHDYYEANKESLWANYKRSHNKAYKDVTEERRREANYHGNMRKALEMHKSNPHARFGGESMYADMSAEEFAAYHTGYVPMADTEMAEIDTHKFSEELLLGATSRLAQFKDPADCHDMKDLLDWSKVGMVAPVKNQGSCGSCWSFAANAALESQWAIQGHGLVSLSEQQLLECVQNGCKQCEGGRADLAYDWLVEHFDGEVTTENAYSYKEGHHKPGDAVAACPGKPAFPTVGAKLTGKKYIERNETEMYTALIELGPLSVAVDATNFQHYAGGIMTNCSSTPNFVDHAVLLVGHGYDPEADMQYWVLKNSWGTTWGENGYVRVQFGTNQCNIASQKPVIPLVDAAPSHNGTVPERPDPFHVTPAPAPPPTEVGGVCIAGDDCECPNWLSFMNIGTSKVAGICDEPLALAVIVVFLLGCLAGSCLCGGRVHRRRQQYAKC